MQHGQDMRMVDGDEVKWVRHTDVRSLRACTSEPANVNLQTVSSAMSGAQEGAGRTMKFAGTAKVPAKRVLKYHRIS